MLMAMPFGRLVAEKDQIERRGNQQQHHGMGRTPCCDKLGIKKGPWTPEEDIILVSYIQQHGPGNWRSVPTHTGLLRCSKSCRLRWTNYLRPGIKRGNFTPHEEGIIVHLQALLGNKWAAIASYLPQRTDNDIKNYWNTHLKKKIKKLQMGPDSSSPDQFVSKGIVEKGNLDIGNTSTTHGLNHSSNSAIYASSTENISRLLEGWMRSSSSQDTTKQSSCAAAVNAKGAKDEVEGDNPISKEDQEGFESMISFDNLNGIGSWDKMEAGDINNKNDYYENHENVMYLSQDRKVVTLESNNPPAPLSFLEKWLLDETSVQLEETSELPVIS